MQNGERSKHHFTKIPDAHLTKTFGVTFTINRRKFGNISANFRREICKRGTSKPPGAGLTVPGEDGEDPG